MDRVTDVVVIGAGFAGLAAARACLDQGHNTLVLEALPRAGGRAHTIATADGGVWDTGAQFINGDMRRVLGLARRFNMALAPAPLGGRPSVLGPAGATPEALAHAMAEAEGFDEQVVEDPASFAGCATVADMIARAGLSPLGAALVGSMVAELCNAAPDAISAAWLLDGDSRYLSERDDIEFVLPEGFGGLAQRLAATLGDRLVLGAPVMSIAHGKQGVVVRTQGGVVRADRAIIALSPPLAAAMVFEPALPEPLAACLAAFRPGALIKMRLRYGSCFWRYQGFSGALRVLDPSGVAFADTSDATGASLTAFIGGPTARHLAGLTVEQRVAILAPLLVAALGEEARAVTGVDQCDWIDRPYLGGGYHATVAPGAPVDAPEIVAAGVGPILFAASELAPEFPGYVEGAIASGQDAAARLVAPATRALVAA